MNNEFIENAKLTDEDLKQVAGGASSTVNWDLVIRNIPKVKPQTIILNELYTAIIDKDSIKKAELLVRASEIYREKYGVDLKKELGLI